MSLSRDDIASLATALAESGLAELHLTGPGTDLHLIRPGGTRAPAQTPAPHAARITAPGFGVFLPRHPLRTEPLASPGQRVRAGQVVALLRIGSLLRQVVAPADGIISAALVEDCALVGFGTALFAFHPDPSEVQP